MVVVKCINEYNYDGDSPVWTEVEPGHFVYANRAELHACQTIALSAGQEYGLK